MLSVPGVCPGPPVRVRRAAAHGSAARPGGGTRDDSGSDSAWDARSDSG
jgi:hypothetical protein